MLLTIALHAREKEQEDKTKLAQRRQHSLWLGPAQDVRPNDDPEDDFQHDHRKFQADWQLTHQRRNDSNERGQKQG